MTGLTPTAREDDLLKTLRKPEYFGQYGNIQKISISNRRSSDGQNQSLGIYVTYEKKEEAQRCIQAVNGSQNGDRVLRAQLGTTKYCSAWLRHEQCTNRQCMFLHEQGDEEDSYTRQDLSSMNSINSQRPFANQGSSSRSVSRQQMQPQPSQPSQPSQVATSQPMARSSSKDGSENGDGSALPSSANWARNPQVRSRRGSHATSGAASSPAVSMSLPVTAESAFESESAIQEEPSTPTPAASETPSPSVPAEAAPPRPKKSPGETLLTSLLNSMGRCPYPSTTPNAQSLYQLCPPLFDSRGGEKRRAMHDDENRLGDDQEPPVDAQEPEEGEPESSGSLALGGEPEDREQSRDGHAFDQRRGSTQPPIQRTATAEAIFGSVGGNYMQGSNLGTIGNRTLTPQQSSFFNGRGQSFGEQLPPGMSAQSNLFQSQGHSRQSSRYSFANETGGASTTVKLAANPRIMAQQSSMMPSPLHSQQSNSFYAPSMPGPPPGLKTTGTPPNSMFGQGHSLGGPTFGGGGTSKDNQILQEMLRGRGGSGQAHDAAKSEFLFPSFSHQYPPSTSSTPAPAPGFSASLYGSQPGAFQDIGSKQKKKGKKHRHANTSSSGGSGLVVDLADPNILRMPHHPQSNAGVGQGLFGGQAQGGYQPGMMYNANAGYSRNW